MARPVDYTQNRIVVYEITYVFVGQDNLRIGNHILRKWKCVNERDGRNIDLFICYCYDVLNTLQKKQSEWNTEIPIDFEQTWQLSKGKVGPGHQHVCLLMHHLTGWGKEESFNSLNNMQMVSQMDWILSS